MKPFPGLSAVLMGTAAALVILHPAAVFALSRESIAQIALAVTVKIVGTDTGSGVIVKHQGNTYTVLSVEHVVDTEDNYNVITNDGQKHPVDKKAIKKLPEGVDLVILQFNSTERYQVVALGDSNRVASGTPCYVSGFPIVPGMNETRYQFSEGQIGAHASHALEGGYALAYLNETFAGMSGGPLLDSQGQLIGIHGQAMSSFTETKGIDPNSGIKIALNLAIPINRFLRLVSQFEPRLDLKGAETTVASTQVAADDLIVKNVEEGIKGNASGDLANIDRAIQLSPQNSFAYFLRGSTRGSLEDNKGEIADYDQAIRINPDFAEAYYNRGSARSSLGQNQEAIADYDQAIRINPNFALAYLNRGLARSALGDKQSAIADYDQAIRINPNFAFAYNKRGLTRSALGDKQGAIADYNQAVRINPSDAFAYYNRGLAHSALRDNKGEIADYDQAIRINPNFSEAYYNRGKVRSDLGDNQGAIADYDQAIRINPDFALAYLNRGSARSESGDNKGAIADYDQVIRINPNFALVYYNRGLVRSVLGDKKGEIADYDQAIRINPNFAEAYSNRGAAHAALGNKKSAIEDLQKAAELFKDNSRTTDYQKAIELLKKGR